jgi:hypothetical protein
MQARVQPKARLGGQEKKEKKVGSFSTFLSSWGSPWSVSQQAPKEAFLAFRPFEGEAGVGFGLGLGLVWSQDEYAGDAAERRLSQSHHRRQIRSVW